MAPFLGIARRQSVVASAFALLLLLSAASTPSAIAQPSVPALHLGVVASIALPQVGPAQWSSPVVDPVTGNLYLTTGLAFAAGSYRAPVVAISGTTDQIVSVSRAGPDPGYPCVDLGTGNVYVPNFDQGPWAQANVTVLSGTTGLPLANVTTPEQPSYVVYDPDNGDLYVNDAAGISVISGSTDQLLTNITPAWTSAGLFDPANGDIYGISLVTWVHGQPSTNVLTVVSPVTDRLVATVNLTGNPAYVGEVVVDPVNGDLYVAGENGLYVVSGETNTQVAYIPLEGFDAWGMSIWVAPDGDLDVLAQAEPETVSVISASTNQVVSSWAIGEPWFVTYDVADQLLFADDTRNGTITMFNATSHSVLSSLTYSPSGAAALVPPVWDPENDQLYLTDEGGPVVVVSPHAPLPPTSPSPFPPWVYLTEGGIAGFLIGTVVVVLALRRRSARTENDATKGVAEDSASSVDEDPKKDPPG